MEIGLFLNSTGPALSGPDFAVTARAAEARGFHSLWEDDPSACETPHYRLPPCRLWPKPLQRPLPVHVGDNSDGALHRAAGADQLVLFALDVRPENREERLDAYAETFLEPARAL